ncbi:C-5 cytosine-specific DNA methylase [Anoxybacillus sp. BCO1]|nr:C-5 cytosine-specific DNA methylase [Anoxybacillus sp. BCO1]
MFTVVSLFSGCGGGDLGLHGDFEFLGNYYSKLPFKTIYANEIDPKVAEIFSENFNIILMSVILEMYQKMTSRNMMY